MQAVAKHGGPPEREALVKEVLPRFLELAKNPYGHFLVSKLLALAPKPKLPGTPAHPPTQTWDESGPQFGVFNRQCAEVAGF